MFEDMFIRFDRIHERDEHTDRQTDGRTDTAWQHMPSLHSIARQNRFNSFSKYGVHKINNGRTNKHVANVMPLATGDWRRHNNQRSAVTPNSLRWLQNERTETELSLCIEKDTISDKHSRTFILVRGFVQCFQRLYCRVFASVKSRMFQLVLWNASHRTKQKFVCICHF